MTDIGTQKAQILQANIQRMWSASVHCKTWCITIVSAAILFAVKESRPEVSLMMIVPILLFLFLDSYYLAVEREFRLKFREGLRPLFR